MQSCRDSFRTLSDPPPVNYHYIWNYSRVTVCCLLVWDLISSPSTDHSNGSRNRSCRRIPRRHLTWFLRADEDHILPSLRLRHLRQLQQPHNVPRQSGRSNSLRARVTDTQPNSPELKLKNIPYLCVREREREREISRSSHDYIVYTRPGTWVRQKQNLAFSLDARHFR